MAATVAISYTTTNKNIFFLIVARLYKYIILLTWGIRHAFRLSKNDKMTICLSPQILEFNYLLTDIILMRY